MFEKLSFIAIDDREKKTTQPVLRANNHQGGAGDGGKDASDRIETVV